jgi:hypothetical protein
MKLINKLKRLIGINVAEYDILYTNPLTISQKTQLANKMITKFPSSCRPNRITVNQQSVGVTMENACLSGELLKKISDDTVAPDKADISSIKLDGNTIWSKNN